MISKIIIGKRKRFKKRSVPLKFQVIDLKSIFSYFTKDPLKDLSRNLSFLSKKEKIGRMVHKLKAKTISYLNVFSDGFGSFRDGVSGEFSWEDELDS